MRHVRPDLTGKVALITGGSRGLGKEMALAFAECGADVVVASRRLEACEEVAKEIEALGRQALPISAHMGRWEDADRLVDAAYERFGKVDILVNNAGKSPLYESLDAIDEGYMDAVLGLNLKVPFRMAVLVGKRMLADGGGSIINISSVNSYIADTIALPYSAAKAGLNVISEGLAKAYGPSVRVNTIAPGAFATDISKGWPDGLEEQMSGRVSLQRVGQPSEIVGAALFLASDMSTYVTGTLLKVDGGA